MKKSYLKLFYVDKLYFHYSLFKNHLERIIERPGKVVERRAPLARVESGTLTAEDMRENGLRKPSLFTTFFELREGDTKTRVSR